MKWLISVAVFVVASNIDIYLARTGVAISGIHVGLGLSIILAATGILLFRRNLALGRFTRFVVAFGALMLWSLLAALFSIDVQLSTLTIARYGAIAVGMIALASLANINHNYDRALATGLLAALLVVVGTVLIDAVNPGTFSRQATRAAGLYINPNGAAQGLILIYIALLAVWRRPRLDSLMVAAYALVAVGVFLTLSRSGIVLFALLTLSISALYFSRRLAIYAGVLAILTVSAVLIYGETAGVSQFQNVTTTNRLSKIFTLQAYFDQDDARVRLLRSYLGDQIGLMGSGPGVSTQLNEFGGATHNVYAKLYWESGLISVVLYLLVLVSPLAANRSMGTILAICTVGILGLFTNYSLDNRMVYFVILLGLANAAPRARLAPKMPSDLRGVRS